MMVLKLVIMSEEQGGIFEPLSTEVKLIKIVMQVIIMMLFYLSIWNFFTT